MSYGIYILHDRKKVGLAKNLDDRLAQQGYTREEAVIFMEDIQDLAVARMMEKQVQKQLGYTAHEQGEDLVDKALKKQAMGKHFKTFEGNTIGFPVEQIHILSLIGSGCTLETNNGTYNASADDIAALHEAGHLRKSRFEGKLKTYIYCKIVDNYFKDKKDDTPRNIPTGSVDGLLDSVHAWARDRGILDGRIETQTLKLGEEFGELQKAVLKNKPLEIKDAIGDIIVVLVSIAHFNGHSVGDALQMAYDTISKRTGYTNDKGDFIKTHFNGEKL